MSKKQLWKEKQKRFKLNVPHRFDRKVCHWVYCSGCGLVALKNDRTRKLMNRPCNSMEE